MSYNYLSSLYQEWEMLLDSLSGGLVGNLRDINDEYSAIIRVYNTAGIREIFTKWLSNLNATDSKKISLEKSQNLAEKWREKGNEFYIKGDFSNSLKYYNLSLLSAPRNHISFPLALGNRSAVLVAMSKFKEALSDMDLALECGYPAAKVVKLEKRKQKCLDSLDVLERKDTEVVKKLSVLNVNHEHLAFDKFDSAYACLSDSLLPNKNSTLQGAGDNIDLRCSEECGRYVIATKNLKRDEVVFVEKPYAFVALPGPNGVLPVVCENCCQNNKYPIPCTECAGSIYCSQKCRREAWETFHKWECNGTIKLLWPTIGIAHLAMRVLLIASKENFGLKTECDCSYTAKQILDEINKDNNSPDAISGYHRVYNLVTNFDKMQTKDLLQYTLTSVMLTMYLKHHTNFFESVAKVLGGNIYVLEVVICSLLLRQLGQMVSSGHAVSGVVEDDQGGELRQIRLATGIFPSASMMNHSCDSNIINNYHGSVLVVRASRDVSFGDEVFNCYGPSYKTARGDKRRSLLKGQYLFDCHCTACSSQEKDNFFDNFNYFNCVKCSNAIKLDNKQQDVIKCVKCSHQVQSNRLQQDLDESLELFDSAEETSGPDKIRKLLAAFKIQTKCLAKYNCHLQKTMDALAKAYAYEGSYDESISLINQLVPSVRYQFGENHLEVGHELQKLCDVMLMKWNTMSDNTSSEYRDLVKDLKSISKNILEIFYYGYGSWTSIYKDAEKRYAEIAEL